MNHEQFQVMLDELAGKYGVGQEVLGEVLARVSLKAPEETSRIEIAEGNPPPTALLTSALSPRALSAKQSRH